jgi:hypothetical protein
MFAWSSVFVRRDRWRHSPDGSLEHFETTAQESVTSALPNQRRGRMMLEIGVSRLDGDPHE